ncbi:DMP12 family DNA mimic protein [Aureibacter tunicatorum]|uniref:Uncharacterized protein n=1 Tax=Aureibacter tunicatorum TaxID=866807 RepID=A0AAE4BVN3_9BACT|nr:DMP12 family DNA mimic protein [Aureibacter tunicatorum]MDR6242097.1 hypothetical protein [Aureibacter tunicatorum]BDD05638.1 hypothetical protein AUTU_31210 [Aureibacter tunicatorum]
MVRIYPIFVLAEEINESQMNYSEAISWCYDNLNNPRVFVLQEEDIYFIQQKTCILDIINEEGDCMLQVGEDDWIISNEIKKRIYERFMTYIQDSSQKLKTYLNPIIDLFSIAIKENKNIYFLF